LGTTFMTSTGSRFILAKAVVKGSAGVKRYSVDIMMGRNDLI